MCYLAVGHASAQVLLEYATDPVVHNERADDADNPQQ